MGEPQRVMQFPRASHSRAMAIPEGRKLLTTLARGESHGEKGVANFQKRGSLLGESSWGVRRR